MFPLQARKMYICAMLATSPPGGGEVLPRLRRGRFQAEQVIECLRAEPAFSQELPSPLRPRAWLPELQIIVVNNWSPKAAVWQRQLNHDAIWEAKHLECLRPLPEQQPEEIAPEAVSGWGFYIIPDLKTWADNAMDRSPMERFASFEEARARFSELRAQDYNSEVLEPGPDGRPPARLTLGLESRDGLSAADILHPKRPNTDPGFDVCAV